MITWNGIDIKYCYGCIRQTPRKWGKCKNCLECKKGNNKKLRNNFAAWDANNKRRHDARMKKMAKYRLDGKTFPSLREG